MRPRSAGEGVVEVSDDGIGIPRAEQRRVFEDFFRASNAPKGQEGAGLGLAISAEIAGRFGGSMDLEPGEEGRGLRVRVRLPAI